ncbi:MAG: U32 family peptidase [Alphaproteobacteria bacterium]
MENKSVELLSPAGNFECGIAGFTYGADAIYLGLKNFSARADAMNFSDTELYAIVNYAHQNGKKVYVAINTVIQNDEIEEVVQKLALVNDVKVDGVIIQDFGVVNIIKKYFPNLEMHASTQMAVHNLDGAIALRNLGFSRCVLARELSLKEIENITKNCGIETEVFIHGALCYSYSGLCMYSSFIKGESANRGKCTYPCRKIYGGDHPYSMKDLCLGSEVKKLCDIGVASLKIEGRKKTPLYVAATADYYRKVIDGKDTSGCIENIKRIFARPFTELHLNGKNKDVIDREFSGPRGLYIGKIVNAKGRIITFKTLQHIAKHDGLLIPVSGEDRPFGFALDNIKIAGKYVFEAKTGDMVEIKLPENAPMVKKEMEVYCASSMEVKGAYPYTVPMVEDLIPKEEIDIKVNICKSKIVASSVIDGHLVEEVLEGDFEPAQNLEKMHESVFNAFSKLGDSSFILRKFDSDNVGVFAPISVLNKIRRNLVEKMEEIKANRKLSIPSVLQFNKECVDKSNIVIKIDDVAYLDNFDTVDFNNIFEVIVDIDCDFSKLNYSFKDKVRIGLPVIVRNGVMAKLKDKVREILSLGYKKFQISNIFGLNLMREFDINDFTVDYHIYSLNNFAVEFWKNLGAKRITLSVEDSKDNINSIISNFAKSVDVIAYQDTPLFIADNCTGECEKCAKNKNTIVKNCRNFVLSERPFCINEKLSNMAKPFAVRYDFCLKEYTSVEVAKIFRNLLKGGTPDSFTIANFDRGFK